MKPQSRKQKEVSPDKEKRYNLRPRKTITRTNEQKYSKSKPKKMKQIIEGEMNNKSSSKTLPKKHIYSLSPELIGRVFQWGLSVGDRLHCERVSPRWRWIVGAIAWSEQRKLDFYSVFEGASDEWVERFTHANLISLLGRFAGPKLVELDLRWFEREHDPASIVQIAKSLSSFPNLNTLHISDFNMQLNFHQPDIYYFNLHDFVDFLPSSLRKIQTFEPISLQTLGKLATRCPNLEEVPFEDIINVNLKIVNEFMGKFPRQKSLDLCFFPALPLPNNATFEAIGQLKELIELFLDFHRDFDEENERAFGAMAERCVSLRKIMIGSEGRLTERALLHLAKMPSLSVLQLSNFTSIPFTDTVLRAIAKRGQLKRLSVQTNKLTDEGIVYLLDHCKSLVSLYLHQCRQISERSLEAVVAEVHRRHGTPPRALPSGPDDKGIFYFGCWMTKIDKQKADGTAAGNPWLKIEWQFACDPR